MKRKLFIFLAIVAFAICVFALAVGASTIYKDAQGNTLFSFEMDSSNIITIYEGAFPKTDADGNALTWYVTATAKDGNNTVKTVDSVLTLDENYASLVDGKYTYTTSVVTPLTVVSANFPSDKGIKELNLPNAGYRYADMYTYNPNGSEILFVYLPNTLEKLPERIVQASKALVCEIPSDAKFATISHVNFHHSKCLREINIPSSVQIIQSKNANDGCAFYQCVSLERVTFGENSVLTEIQSEAFNGCTSLKEITLPDSLLTLGSYAFYGTVLVNSPFTRNSKCQSIGKGCFERILTLKSFIIPNGIVELDALTFLSSSTNLEFVGFGNNPSLRVIKKNCFNGRSIQNGQAFSKLVIETLPDCVTTVEDYAFMYTAIVDSPFSPTSKCTSIGHQAFAECTSLKEVFVPKDATFVTDLSNYGASNQKSGLFFNCQSLERVTFHEDTQVKVLPTYMFASCSSLKEIKIPNSVTTLSARMFDRCVKLETIIMGANVTTLNHGRSWSDGHNSFTYGCTSLKYVYFPVTLDMSTGHTDACHVFSTKDYGGNFAKLTLFVNGDYEKALKIREDFEKVSSCNNNDRVNGAEIISLEEYNGLSEITKNYIVYGVNTCDAFYDGEHTLTGGDCTKSDSCENCEYESVAQENHTVVESLTYKNGFTQNGLYLCECIFNGCTVIDIKAGDAKSVASPLFGGGDGFSTKLEDGIAGGYLINVNAVNEYKRINGSLTFGIMAVNPIFLAGKDSFFDSNGKVNTTVGALQVSMVDNQYENISISITGFVGDAEDLSLVIALYAYDDPQNVQFIQSSTTKCADKNVTLGDTTLYTVTLASVKNANSVPTKLDAYIFPTNKEI